MAEKQEVTVLYKKEIKLPASLGDWTSYKPLKQPSKRIKPLFYGFHRISQDALENTLVLHHFFTHDLAVYLKEALKASIDIYSISLEQLTYLDFLKRVSSGVMYNKLALKGMGEVFMILDNQLANIIINFSLGSQSIDSKAKDLTDVEESILKSVFGKVLDKFSARWGGVFEKPEFEIISYPSVQRETHINLNEVITVITAQISVANSMPSTITFVYQNSVLRSLTEALKKKTESSPLNIRFLPDGLLSKIEVPVVARLGRTSITAGELAGIEDEDVIALDQKLNEPTMIMMGSASKIKSQPGTLNGRLAVRILGGSATKIMNAPIATDEDRPSPAEDKTAAPAESQAQAIQQKEEDFELPMEEGDKEEYNPSQENIFEDDESQGAGGK